MSAVRIRVNPRHLPLIATTGVCLLLYLGACLRYDSFFSSRVLVNLVADNAFLGITAIGMTFVILSGGIDLSVGSMVGLTSILTAALVTQHGLHPVLAAPLVLGTGLLIGAAMGCLIGFFELPPFLVTLAGMFLARGLGFVISMESIPISHPLYNRLSEMALPLGPSVSLPLTAIVFLAMTVLAAALAYYSKFGRTVYAIGGSEASALLMGLPVVRTKVLLYAFSGGCSSLAGLVYTLYTFSGYASAGTGLELDAIAAVVIGGTLLTGGVGYVAGTLIGVLILGIIQTAIVFEGTLSSWWTKIAIGLLLFVFIVLQRVLSQARGGRTEAHFAAEQGESP